MPLATALFVGLPDRTTNYTTATIYIETFYQGGFSVSLIDPRRMYGC
jgi:hypothetical protein